MIVLTYRMLLGEISILECFVLGGKKASVAYHSPDGPVGSCLRYRPASVAEDAAVETFRIVKCIAYLET